MVPLLSKHCSWAEIGHMTTFFYCWEETPGATSVNENTTMSHQYVLSFTAFYSKNLYGSHYSAYPQRCSDTQGELQRRQVDNLGTFPEGYKC